MLMHEYKNLQSKYIFNALLVLFIIYNYFVI